MQTNGCCCVSIIRYLQGEAGGWIWPTSHSVSTPGLSRTWSQTEAAKEISPAEVGLPREGKIRGEKKTQARSWDI